jgi:hypothetical protein
MSTPRSRRLAKERKAAELIESHHSELEALLIEVTSDIGGELLGLSMFQRDCRLAAQMAYQLDKATDWSSPLMEAADWFIYYLASLAVIGIVRAVERSMKRKKDKLGKLQRRLEERGPKMAKAARRRIERRIARIERAL